MCFLRNPNLAGQKVWFACGMSVHPLLKPLCFPVGAGLYGEIIYFFHRTYDRLLLEHRRPSECMSLLVPPHLSLELFCDDSIMFQLELGVISFQILALIVT